MAWQEQFEDYDNYKRIDTLRGQIKIPKSISSNKKRCMTCGRWYNET